MSNTLALAQSLRVALEPLCSGITAAFVYGSIARGDARDASDIDLMVLSDSLDYAQVFEALQPLEATLSRAINPIVMSVADWTRKRAAPESFVSRVAVGAKVWVVGSDDDLP